MNLKHFSIFFSISGITILYVISIFCRPVSIEISEISHYEGKEIITKGYVKEIVETKFKSQIITIQNNNSSVIIFSEEKTDFEYGDYIKVSGQVQKFEDSYEIMVENKKNIILLKKWDNITIPLWQLSLNPEKYDGLNVKVKGVVDNIFNSYFHLKDDIKSNTIIVSYLGGNKLYLKSGSEVIVKGIFNFDKENFRYMINLFSENHGITYQG